MVEKWCRESLRARWLLVVFFRTKRLGFISRQEIGKLQKVASEENYGNNLRSTGCNLPEVEMWSAFSSGLGSFRSWFGLHQSRGCFLAWFHGELPLGFFILSKSLKLQSCLKYFTCTLNLSKITPILSETPFVFETLIYTIKYPNLPEKQA